MSTSHPIDHENGKRSARWSEGIVGDALRKAVEKGIEAGVVTLSKADTVLRDTKMPRDVVNQVLSQVSGTKNVLVRGVADEVRAFLLATDLAGELHRVLTSLSFEIKTEIRFVPSEKGAIKVKPEVRHLSTATKRVTSTPKKSKRRRRSSSASK